MKCPICNNELKEGEILCPQGKFKWVPKGTKLKMTGLKSFGKIG
ncbi:MAG: PF20097 family protein [Sarcina sp.]